MPSMLRDQGKNDIPSPGMPWDCIFVGGGLSASVTANRLLGHDPALRILVVEAGADASHDQSIVYPDSTNLIGGQYDWKYKTVPQVHLDGRQVDLPCGKALGGGTVINSGAWSRGARRDYDLWAETVGHHRWGYDGLLPYFRETERVADASVHPEQHGARGPVSVQGVVSTSREFPLRARVLESWKAVGVDALPCLDGNAGEPNGVGDFFENRRDGRRQIASVAYPLDGVSVLTDTLAAAVLLEPSAGDPERPHRAVGIRLADGAEMRSREVVLSAGAVRTPQILMLSGIGPPSELARHGIVAEVDAPDVGRHLADHGMFQAMWRLREPSAGYALGSGNPLFGEPRYGWGSPADFLVSAGVGDKEGLTRAIEEFKEGKCLK